MEWRDAEGNLVKDPFPENSMDWAEYERWLREKHSEEEDDKDLEIVTHTCDECGELKPCIFTEDPFEVEMAHEREKVTKKWLCQPCHHELYVKI